MSDILLTSEEAIEEVELLRVEPSESLNNVKKKLISVLKDQSCLVLGSSPSAKIPSLTDFDRCLCVNGSPYIAHENSLIIDVTVLIGYTTAMKKDISALSMNKISGIHTNELLFVSAGDTFENCLEKVKELDFTFGSASELSPLERAAIIGEVCGVEFGLGPRDERISNGVFTIIAALWAGARKVIVSGISLSGGHHYAQGTPRHHLIGDEACLKLLGKSKYRVLTTSSELSEMTGLELYS